MRVLRLAALFALAAGLVTAVGSTSGAQPPTYFGMPATIVASPGVPTVGTSGADVIVGTSGDDDIRARGGRDRVCAKGGDDRVWGGRGADMINLGSGDDVGRGGSGDDLIRGKGGRDLIWGNNGEDLLDGGSGFDMLFGGKKADELLGKSGADALEGNSGPDDLFGGKGIDACNGGTGSDTLSSCNELVPFGPNPFVGWWSGTGLNGSTLSVTIDPAGNLAGTDTLGAPGTPCTGVPATWSLTGRQTAAHEWTPDGMVSITCHPGGTTQFTTPWVGDYDPNSKTVSLEFGICYWRRGSSPSDCI